MRIKVFPPHGCDRSALDERGWAELSDGASVADVLRLIRCSRIKAKLLLVSRNGERITDLDTPLQDGDVIGFFFPVAGG